MKEEVMDNNGETQCPVCGQQVFPWNRRAVPYRDDEGTLVRLGVVIDPSSDSWKNLWTITGGKLGPRVVEAVCCDEKCAWAFEKKPTETALKRTRREDVLARA